MKWDDFFNWLMEREGRVIHTDPRDAGGQTCWGIARRYNPRWRGWALIDNGTTSGTQLESAIKEFYVLTYGGMYQRLPERVREVAVDTAVNMGQDYAVKCLQDALCKLAGSTYVTVDGKLGPQTLEAVRHADPSALAFAMCATRLAEYGRRGRQGDQRRVFLDGWITRVRTLMEAI